MRAAALDAAPSVDGRVLGDDAWRDALPASGFWQVQPHDGAPATQKTEVFVGYTDTALYIGVVAYDDDPAGIIVTDSRRDSSLDDTDAFLVVIDGLLDRQNGYVFGTNAAGIDLNVARACSVPPINSHVTSVEISRLSHDQNRPHAVWAQAAPATSMTV